MQKNNKTLIVQESIKLFYKQGYNKTTMRQIGQACNIAHPSIFNHFKNKSAIADVMFYRYLHGIICMTQRYIEDKGIDLGATHEAMAFYWTAHYYYVKNDSGYLNFLREHYTVEKMSEPLVNDYFEQVLRNLILWEYKTTPGKQILYTRLITSSLLILSLSYYENSISLEEAVIEHFYLLYSTFKIKRGISDKGISTFIRNLDIKKYLNSNLLEDVLLSDFGKPYQPLDTNDLFI